MIKKIIAIAALLVFAYTNSSFDNTTIVKIYEIDNIQYVDYERDNNLYIGVYIEDL
jgi:hypothetical protein